MAINFLQVSILRRSQNENALAMSAYIDRGITFDESTGKYYDYRYRGVALFSEILMPDKSPSWLMKATQSNQRLWTLVEKTEMLKKSQIARCYIIALAHELSLDQQIEFVREFIKVSFTSKGMVASYAIHPPSNRGDQRNAHVHIMVTMRLIGEKNFIKKERQWNSKKFIYEVRENFMELSNLYLEKNLCKERIRCSRQIELELAEAQAKLSAHAKKRSNIFVRVSRNLDNQLLRQDIESFIRKTLPRYSEEQLIISPKNQSEEQQYWLDQYDKVKKKISIENIRKDFLNGRDLCAEDLYSLGEKEHGKIIKLGPVYLTRLINDAQREKTFGRER